MACKVHYSWTHKLSEIGGPFSGASMMVLLYYYHERFVFLGDYGLDIMIFLIYMVTVTAQLEFEECTLHAGFLAMYGLHCYNAQNIAISWHLPLMI